MGKSKKTKKTKKTNPNVFKIPIQIHAQPIKPIHELIICGHSSKSIGTFKLPKNIKIIFFANKNEQCIVPDTFVNLKSCVSEMRGKNEATNIYTNTNETNQCPNYNVTFNNSTRFDGISLIQNDDFSQHGTNPFKQIFTVNEDITLEQCCKRMQSIYGPGSMLTIYCIFCRGSNRDSNFDSLIDVGIQNVDDIELSDDFKFDLINDNFIIGMDADDNGIDQNSMHVNSFDSDDFALLSSLDNGAIGLKTKKMPKRKKRRKTNKKTKK